MVQNTTLSMQRIARLNAVDIANGLDFRFSAPLSFRFVFDIACIRNQRYFLNDVIRAVTSHGEALN